MKTGSYLLIGGTATVALLAVYDLSIQPVVWSDYVTAVAALALIAGLFLCWGAL